VSIDANDEIRTSLHDHLSWWGLKHVTSDQDYFAWQRQQLTPDQLKQLHLHVERKRVGDERDEIAFYDLTAQPKIYPVLYSQRYEYYKEIGLRALARLGDAEHILDLGCGLGILTTFYARRFPEKTFVGVDRSAASIAVAQQKANALGLRNLRFICLDVEREALSGAYDLVIATHVLLQAEQDPGIPSKSWRTFERTRDTAQQASFEQRTGLARRLDQLCTVLNGSGHMIVCEKARQLARRVPFQRALAGQGLQLIAPPEVIRYRSIEEVTDDGPFYVLQKVGAATMSWDESPEPDEAPGFDRRAKTDVSTDLNQPLYENHGPSAQTAWERLDDRTVIREVTNHEPDGRAFHVELGSSRELLYLYCANTFDQRQLVIVEAGQSLILEQYYREISEGLSRGANPL